MVQHASSRRILADAPGNADRRMIARWNPGPALEQQLQGRGLEEAGREVRGSKADQVFRRGEETARSLHVVPISRNAGLSSATFLDQRAWSLSSGVDDGNDVGAVRYFGVLKPSRVSTAYLR
jgi:hypothetical protein